MRSIPYVTPADEVMRCDPQGCQVYKVGSIGLFLSVLLAGCEVDKTKNPLSPSVAGPIAGVTISAPRLLEPSAGVRMTRPNGPVQLLIENASSTGVRPLTYLFEVSTDVTFSSLAFTRGDVPPGSNGRTAIGISVNLEAGRPYYWRARAGDGANAGPFSPAAHFIIAEPVVLQPPAPISPINNQRIDGWQATLRTRNADRSGTTGAVSYDFELADQSTFAPLLDSRRVGEQPDATQVTMGPTLTPDRTYYWRVRAVDPTLAGPWSAVQAFRTATAPAPPPPPPPPPGPGTPPPSAGSGIPSVEEGMAMVAWVKGDLERRGISLAGDCGAFQITRRVAWQFRDRGAGLERKPGGRNCEGHSIDIVIFPGGQTVDMLVGSGDDNSPAWQLHGVLPDWRDWWIAPSDPDR